MLIVMFLIKLKKGLAHYLFIPIPAYVQAFSLLEMAFVLMIMGCMSSITLPFFSKQLQLEKEKQTHHTFEQITYGLAAFFLQHKRMPCPASPDITGHNHGIEAQDNCHQPGIVPYKTLGISPSLAKDGHHHWITYAVSPDFATYELVFNDDSDPLPSSLPHHDFSSPFGQHRQPEVPLYSTITPLRNYWTMIDPNPISLLDRDLQPLFHDERMGPLFILISHGTKGGDFLSNGTSQRRPFAEGRPHDRAKQHNVANDLTFVEQEKTTSYDDHIFFKNRFIFARAYAGITYKENNYTTITR